MPGEGLTHGPPANKKAGGSHHRFSRSTGIPRAMAYGLYVISPGTGFLAPVPRDAKHHRGSDNAQAHRAGISTGMPGPHDFAVRIDVVRPTTRHVHRFPASRLVTIAMRPSSPRRDETREHRFLKKRKLIIFGADLETAHRSEAACEIRRSAQCGFGCSKRPEDV
jgi:hypothetical protein